MISAPWFLPHRPFKKIGIATSLTCLAAIIIALIVDSEPDWEDTLMSIVYLGLVIGLLLWSFSKNKVEDEMVMQQRLERLQIAVYLNYGVLLMATLLLYSFWFLYFLWFAEFSLLLYFVLSMEYISFKNTKLLNMLEGGISYEK
ncbi:MAG: hypothetical protein V4541_05380 [Bacteroidota bacterium]